MDFSINNYTRIPAGCSCQKHGTVLRTVRFFPLHSPFSKEGCPFHPNKLNNKYFPRTAMSNFGIEDKSLLSAFSEFAVKTGLLDSRYHAYFHKAFEARHDCDYLSVPAETKEGAVVMLDRAEEFVSACRTFLENRHPGA